MLSAVSSFFERPPASGMGASEKVGPFSRNLVARTINKQLFLGKSRKTFLERAFATARVVVSFPQVLSKFSSASVKTSHSFIYHVSQLYSFVTIQTYLLYSKVLYRVLC